MPKVPVKVANDIIENGNVKRPPKPLGGHFSHPPDNCPHKVTFCAHEYADMAICEFYCRLACPRYESHRKEFKHANRHR